MRVYVCGGYGKLEGWVAGYVQVGMKMLRESKGGEEVGILHGV